MSGGAPDRAFNRDAQGRWDQGAAIYDARRVRSRSRWFLALERRMYATLLPPPPAGRRLRILDAGCGTGELSAWLAARGDVVSVDLSAASLAVGRARPDALRLVQGDLTQLPLASASVDAIVSNVVLPHLPDELVLRALAELHRVLRPDGRMIFTVFNWDGLRGFRSFPTAVGHFPSGVYYRAYTAPELEALMAKTAFTDVQIRGLGMCYAATQPRRGWHGLYHRLGWVTAPVEHLLQCRLGWLPRAGAYLVVTARP